MPRYTIHTISRNPATWIRLGVRAYLHDCKRRAMDMRPAWPYVLAVLRRNMEEVFDNEGAVDGEPRWKENSRRPIHFHGQVTRTFRLPGGRSFSSTGFPSYAVWKKLNYPGAKIMELTGKLRQQLTDPGDPTRYVRFQKSKLIFGTNYEQYPLGAGRPRSGRDRLTGDLGGINDAGRTDYYPMEPRELFRITEASLDEISEHIADYVYGV